MKKPKTLAKQLTWWAVLPLLALAALAFLFLLIWKLKFPVNSREPVLEPLIRAKSSPEDGAAFDREMYAMFANRSSRDILQVSFATDDTGEIIFQDHVGYEIYLSYRSQAEAVPDRFLVLDGLDLYCMKEPSFSGDVIFATGRDDGFYFYVDSLKITSSDRSVSYRISGHPGPDTFLFISTEGQRADLTLPEFVWRKPEASHLGEVSTDRDGRWQLYLSFLFSIAEEPVESRETAFSRPYRRSLLSPLLWQECTTETIYPDFLPNTGVHLYSHRLERPLPVALARCRQFMTVVLLSIAAYSMYLHAVTKRIVTQPLSQSIENAAQLAGPDSWIAQALTGRPDEIGELSRALKKAEEAFQEKWDTERALERKRQDFVAAASHDLKTPLALIGGYVEAVQQGIDPEENARYLDSIEREAGKMNRLVLEMLDYTRLDRMEELEHGKRENLAELLDSWLNEAAPLFEELSLERALPRQLFVRCDAALLRRAVDNLFSNAAKFTPKGGNVRVSLGTRPSDGAFFSNARFLLTVENDGEHIPETDLDRIFEMFYRTDRARTRGSSGSGVGLAVAKRICELHGFTLRAENTTTGVRFLLEG